MSQTIDSTSAVPNRSTASSSTPASDTTQAASGSSQNAIKVGSKAIICQDAELRGNITIGAGCVLHPRCTVFAYAGPIVIGDSCILEENVVIINRSKETMDIGAYNLFEVGCRIEALRIGSYNTFEPRCRVSSNITIADYCTIGAGCSAMGDMKASQDDWKAIAQSIPEARKIESTRNELQADVSDDKAESLIAPSEEATQFTHGVTSNQSQIEYLPSYTVIYGGENQRRVWSGEGQIQQVALMHKHLAYLTEALPKYSRLKLFT